MTDCARCAELEGNIFRAQPHLGSERSLQPLPALGPEVYKPSYFGTFGSLRNCKKETLNPTPAASNISGVLEYLSCTARSRIAPALIMVVAVKV